MSEFISDMISERLQRIMKKVLFLLSLRSILISYNLESKKINFCFETSLDLFKSVFWIQKSVRTL